MISASRSASIEFHVGLVENTISVLIFITRGYDNIFSRVRSSKFHHPVAPPLPVAAAVLRCPFPSPFRAPIVIGTRRRSAGREVGGESITFFLIVAIVEENPIMVRWSVIPSPSSPFSPPLHPLVEIVAHGLVQQNSPVHRPPRPVDDAPRHVTLLHPPMFLRLPPLHFGALLVPLSWLIAVFSPSLASSSRPCQLDPSLPTRCPERPSSDC